MASERRDRHCHPPSTPEGGQGPLQTSGISWPCTQRKLVAVPDALQKTSTKTARAQPGTTRKSQSTSIVSAAWYVKVNKRTKKSAQGQTLLTGDQLDSWPGLVCPGTRIDKTMRDTTVEAVQTDSPSPKGDGRDAELLDVPEVAKPGARASWRSST